MSDLVSVRKAHKARKPNFVRHDVHKKAKLKEKWRRPKGIQNKLRLHKRGKGKHISQGYRAPHTIRHRHPSGLQQVTVYQESDLTRIDSKKAGIIIASSVGMRKKISILKKADEMGLTVLNVRSKEFLAAAEKALADRKQKKAKKIAAAKPKKAKEKTTSKEKTKEAETDDKEDADKKEKDKLLTQRER